MYWRMIYGLYHHLIVQNMVQPVYYSPVHTRQTDENHVLFSNYTNKQNQMFLLYWQDSLKAPEFPTHGLRKVIEFCRKKCRDVRL